MKTRILTFTAAALLGITAVCGAICQRKTEKMCSEAAEILEKTVEFSSSGDWENAVLCAEELNEFWRGQRRYIEFLFDHESGCRIAEGLARIGVFAGGKAADALCAEAETVKAHLEALSGYDRLTLGNIF
ncbi:MAG: DUF4363 family protein [Eubacteriales bacterium]